MIKSYNELLENYKINEHGPGFHGDIHLINLVDSLINKSSCFIETGTNMGNTLFFVSQNYDIKCYSCELHKNTPNNVITHENVYFRNTESPQFIYDLVKVFPNITEKICFFWLDAHFNGGENILYDEISFIIDNFKYFYIIADDIDVNNELFSNNGYQIDKIRSMTTEYIFIPNYTERTSNFHGLTGWCLITNQYLNEEKYKIKKYDVISKL